MHRAAVVAGVGESAYYHRGGAPETEFQLACTAIRNAIADAGLAPADVDGVVAYMERNEPVRLSAALGLGDLGFTAQTFGGGGNGAGAAVTIADAAVSAGYADCIVVFRSLAQGQFGRYGQAARRAAGPGERGVHRALRHAHAGPDDGDADDAVHARPRRDPGQPRRDRPGLVRPRPAQPTGDPLRHTADTRAVPRVAVGRRAVPPVRLLPGERRGGGDRRHHGRARRRPRQASGGDRRRRPRPGAPRWSRRLRGGQLPDRPPPPRRAHAVEAGRRDARRRAGGAVLRELHRPGADGDQRDGVLRSGRSEHVRGRWQHPVAGRPAADQHERRQHRRGLHPRVRQRGRGGAPGPWRLDVPGRRRRAEPVGVRSGVCAGQRGAVRSV